MRGHVQTLTRSRERAVHTNRREQCLDGLGQRPFDGAGQ
jgi:hypothetical protein